MTDIPLSRDRNCFGRWSETFMTALGLAILAGLFGGIFRIVPFTQTYREYMIGPEFPLSPSVVPTGSLLVIGLFFLAWGTIITTYKREHAMSEYTPSVFWRIIAWWSKFFAAVMWVGFGVTVAQEGRIATVGVLFCLLYVMLFITEISFDHLYATSSGSM